METDKLTKMMLRIEPSSLYKLNRAPYSILILLMQLVCGLVFSQESYTLKSTSTYFFYSKENYENRIKALQFDSVKTIGYDTIFFLQPNTITQTNDSICLQFKYNLFGSNIIKNLSGDLIFLTIKNDSILLKPGNPLNTEWVMYQDTLLRKIIAKIIKIDTMSILPGIVDSVKYITMTFVNGTNNGKLEKPLIISKNYGFISLYPFLYFPDFNQNDALDHYAISEPFEFIGSKNPNMGLFHLDAFDIYGYDVGDEIHTSYSSWMPIEPSFYSEDVNIVLNKKFTQNNDSIIYAMKHCYKHDNNPRAMDTIHIGVAKGDKYINSFPENFFKSDGDENMLNHVEYFYYSGDSSYCDFFYTNVLHNTPSIVHKSPLYKLSSNPDCWERGMGYCSTPMGSYFLGLGGPYYCCYSPSFLEGEYNKLEYYKKGNRTGGSMLNTCDLSLSNNSEKRSQKKVSIFPNPSDGTFRLSSSVEFKNIILYNVLGEKIPIELFRETNNNDAGAYVVTLQLPSPSPGIYFLEIKGKQDKLLLENNSRYQKLIILK